MLLAEVERTDAAVGVLHDSIASLDNINSELIDQKENSLRQSKSMLNVSCLADTKTGTHKITSHWLKKHGLFLMEMSFYD